LNGGAQSYRPLARAGATSSAIAAIIAANSSDKARWKPAARLADERRWNFIASKRGFANDAVRRLGLFRPFC
jgi:hypothetical protein